MVIVAATACGATSAASSDGTTGTDHGGPYELHMTFFARETHQPTVVDPQVFLASQGTAAGTGLQSITHVAGVAPAPMNAAADTPLLDADGAPLGITLGAWRAAAGTVRLSCAGGTSTVVTAATSMVPSAAYSLFVVHLSASDPAQRFTPLGNAAGTDSSTMSTQDGHLDTTNHVSPCLNDSEALLVVWDSDGHSHGSVPGALGRSAHNHLIVPVTALH